MGMGGRRRAGVLRLALTFPAVVGGSSSWGFHAQLLEPLRHGATSLVLSDCAHAYVGQRLRLGQVGGHEEEAEVLSLRCNAGDAAGVKAAQLLAPAADPCDLAALGVKPADEGDSSALVKVSPADQIHEKEPPKLPERCRAMLEAARRVPGLEDSYRKARQSQQALLPDGVTSLAAEAPKRVPGVITLRTATQFSHDVGDPVHGYSKPSDKVELRATQCAGTPACSGRGLCDTTKGTCECDAGWGGEVCETASCVGGCGTGNCHNGTCLCSPGFTGERCESLATLTTEGCPHDCSNNGRCSAKLQCICAIGYSASDCSVACPNRCSGHGECFDGACTCYEGYEGIDCSTAEPQSIKDAFLGGMFAYYPIFVLFFYSFIFLFMFCFVGYIMNRCNGRFGTSAIPMWDYYAKKWRNAPLFEPVVHSTQRP
ncbi:hypothetical protein AB1Y20_015104 [Prymnesium parvum]|uniref:EGF-like domain-containing protein n=1 Tax=Prymnesium parvum TaxID=97485 RepID=A0AB34JZT0_PRYPA